MIDVIIPVYRGVSQTRACLESVLCRQGRIACEIVAIDDASPESEIRSHLADLAAAGRITLLRNTDNAGFVRSINRGLALHEDRDVMILNSDTEVANDWLDRMHAAAYAHPNVATVTPFSNNATICSYPFEGWTGGLPGTLGLAALDAIFARVNARQSVELPTAVGFCTLIRRDCLRSIGLFDAERFGRGYGEENDFCMRAQKAGWRNVLAADVFVYHEGSVSFCDERVELMKSAMSTLLHLHPEYPLRVSEFIEVDPARELRTAVDRARVARGPDEARQVIGERSQERAVLLGELHPLRRAQREYQERSQDLGDYIDRVNASVAERDDALKHERQILADTRAEVERLRTGLQHAETLVFSRTNDLDRMQAQRARLEVALRNAETIAFDRLKVLEETQAEISRLRAGLQHAETLAFGRLKEIEEIRPELSALRRELEQMHALPLWKLYVHLRRKRTRPSGA